MLSHNFPTHRGNEDPCPERRQCSPVGWGSDWIQRGQERGRWVCIYPSASWSIGRSKQSPPPQSHTLQVMAITVPSRLPAKQESKVSPCSRAWVSTPLILVFQPCYQARVTNAKPTTPVLQRSHTPRGQGERLGRDTGHTALPKTSATHGECSCLCKTNLFCSKNVDKYIDNKLEQLLSNLGRGNAVT